MDGRISLVTLGVGDLERSIDFYENGLGLPRHPLPAEDIAFFALNGTWLSLYPRELLAEDAMVDPDGAGFRGVTLAHNVASEEEVNEVISEAVAAGARLVKSPCKAEWGGYSGYFADPDGHLWEVAHNPFLWIGPPPSEAD
jgi:hypothetical protein